MTTNANELRAAVVNCVQYAAIRDAVLRLVHPDDNEPVTVATLQQDRDWLMAYAGQSITLSDFATADDMRAELERVRQQLAEVTAQRDRLREWKESAMTVMAATHAAWERCGKPGKLGESVSDAMADEVIRLRDELVFANIDSGNYRGKCGMCGTANCDMLTDDYCAACEVDRLGIELLQQPPTLGWLRETFGEPDRHHGICTEWGGYDGPHWITYQSSGNVAVYCPKRRQLVTTETRATVLDTVAAREIESKVTP